MTVKGLPQTRLIEGRPVMVDINIQSSNVIYDTTLNTIPNMAGYRDQRLAAPALLDAADAALLRAMESRQCGIAQSRTAKLKAFEALKEAP